MPSFGFVGPSYQLQAINADNQMTMNFYPSIDESGKGVSPLPMWPTPGLKTFCERGLLARGDYTINARLFAVFDDELCEVVSSGVISVKGNVGNNLQLVSWAATNNQLLVCSAGLLFVYDLVTNTFSAIPGATINNVGMVDTIDAYFVAIILNTNKFRLSGLNDATTWAPLDVEVIEVFSGNIVGIRVDHRELWVLGNKGSTVYYNNGDVNFPLAPNPSAAVIERGLWAMRATVKMDNTIFWVGGDTDRGIGIGYRANGYTPVRITTHAVELAWQSYGTVDISKAVGYTYQKDGHEFWVIYFPDSSKTWVYDAATNMWHERGFWDVNTGSYKAHHSWSHAYAFGKHLVCDWSSGKIYEMSDAFSDDDGALIRRLRRAPCLNKEQHWIYVPSLQIILESGVAPQPSLVDGAGNLREPEINLRWSKDAGHTWSNEITRGIGFAGQYQKRVRWTRIPRGRNVVLEVNMSDPVPYRIVDAIVDIQEGEN